MDNLPVYNVKGERVGAFGLPESLDHMVVKQYCIKEAVVARLANQRQGNASTKTRGQVSGSGKKPWRQKGTGRARIGSIRSPLWRSGGVVFGPHPRDYRIQISQKVKKNAFCSALLSKIKEGKLLVVEAFDMDSPKTRKVSEMLSALGVKEKTLLVDAQPDEGLKRASRNLSNAVLRPAEGVDTYDVVSSRNVVVSRRGLEKVLKRCA